MHGEVFAHITVCNLLRMPWIIYKMRGVFDPLVVLS